jgi:hypothetical protein
LMAAGTAEVVAGVSSCPAAAAVNRIHGANYSIGGRAQAAAGSISWRTWI